ncbi:MAG: sigma factor-like helix-turn-helix DNA-binding protein [Candidatus Hydrogenedentes bacterium]|nr:sigma factor-like helix-turn-helix DNA-binding protein [Candidatus Hydrogenedentota bacterium]
MNEAEPAETTWNDVEPLVDEAVQVLPELLRVPVALHFYEGRTQEAIAKLIAVPRTTVANRIKRGVEDVRKTLRRRGVEIPSAALTAFLVTELGTAAPVGLTASIGKVALAERLPQPESPPYRWRPIVGLLRQQPRFKGSAVAARTEEHRPILEILWRLDGSRGHKVDVLGRASNTRPHQ